jgi:hypothetical protein
VPRHKEGRVCAPPPSPHQNPNPPVDMCATGNKTISPVGQEVAPQSPGTLTSRFMLPLQLGHGRIERIPANFIILFVLEIKRRPKTQRPEQVSGTLTHVRGGHVRNTLAVGERTAIGWAGGLLVLQDPAVLLI